MTKAAAAAVLVLVPLAAGCGDSGESQPAPSSSVSSWNGDPTVRTLYGSAGGLQDAAETWVWRAIPYARPPVGPLRWRAPLEPDSWQGVRESTKYCSLCTQYFPVGDLVVGSEDCLYLNVWRPRSAEKGLPVYFWIHGGGNTIGGGAIGEDYSGANLASRSNLVVVTVNYRLGPLGWLTHPALRSGVPGSEQDDSGNYGTLDLIQALKWVRRNIEAFGGDPDRVLIAGESAGGVNVLSLLISPPARGLFQRAMAESGGPLTSSIEQGEQGAVSLLLELLVQDGAAADPDEAQAVLDGMSHQEIADYLRSKSGEELLAGFVPSFGGMIEVPNVFEDGTVIPAGAYAALDSGEYPNKVPIILGSNKEELKLFLFLDPAFEGRDDLYQVVTAYGSDEWKAQGVDEVARRLAARADQPSAYAYQFLWGAGGESGQSMIPEPWGFKLGSCHTLEIPFFFGNETVNMIMQLLVFNEQNRPGREILSAAMMQYAASFARSGDPNEPGAALPVWEPWSNDPGGPKSILFDVDRDQALNVRMSTEETTREGIRAKLAAEVPEPLYSEAIEYLGW
ncbi:MAG: carboxylesterase family protein [bacterium]